MATLAELGEHVSTELRRRVDQLVAAVESDVTDFTEIGQLASGVGDFATTIGEMYDDIEHILMDGLTGGSRSLQGGNESRSGRERRSEQHDSSSEDVTREELLERARDLNIHGRSSMAKEELAQAVEAEEAVTKEELLERAREAGIEGRSTMTKEELRGALQDAGA
jgi:post-segregation antitoxin (ccd killing protein)